MGKCAIHKWKVFIVIQAHYIFTNFIWPKSNCSNEYMTTKDDRVQTLPDKVCLQYQECAVFFSLDVILFFT